VSFCWELHCHPVSIWNMCLKVSEKNCSCCQRDFNSWFLVQFSSTFIHHQSLPFALLLGFLSNNMTLNFSLLYLLPVYLSNFQNSLFASPPYNIGSLITVLHSLPTNLSLFFLVHVNDLILTTLSHLSTLLTQLYLLPTMLNCKFKTRLTTPLSLTNT
jgi:hypothetical protein